MKTITKFALAAGLAAVGTSAAFADDQQLQNRLAMERQAAASKHETTIAVYAHQRGLGQTAAHRNPELRFEWRANSGKSQGFGSYTSAE